MSLRLAVFDVDGTLIDSQHIIVAAMTHAFVARRRSAPADTAVRAIIGLSLDTAIGRLCPDAGTEDVAGLCDAYRDAFAVLRQDPDSAEAPFPGMLDLLRQLDAEGWTLAVATGKSRRGVQRMIAQNGLNGLFAATGTADDGPGKPHPFMLNKVIAETGADPARSVMIGDTAYDMQMALAAGARAIGVAWGYHPPAELMAAGAEAVVETGADLHNLVKRMVPGSS